MTTMTEQLRDALMLIRNSRDFHRMVTSSQKIVSDALAATATIQPVAAPEPVSWMRDFEILLDDYVGAMQETAVFNATQRSGMTIRMARPRHKNLVEHVLKLAQSTAASAQAAPAEVRLTPLNEDTQDILGRPNFTCIRIAQRLRELGVDIKKRAENEQAAVVHFLLNMYEQHGTAWRERTEEYLRATSATAACASTPAGDSQKGEQRGQ